MPSNNMLDSEKISYWEQKTFFKNIDYLIIGAGIVGYSTALHLKESHPEAKIVIIERGFLPSGASSKNAGFACFGSATELFSDLQTSPEDEVWKTVSLRWKGLQYLRKIIGDSQLKLEINGSWDLITSKEENLFELVKEQLPYYNKKIKAITGEAETYTIDSNISSKFGFEHVKTSIFNRLEGQIDTASMNHAFYKKVIDKNIHVLFGIEAKTLNNNTITSSQGEISADKIAICTNGFGASLIQEDVKPARAQVLITRPIPNLKIKGTFHYNEGYYYFRNIDDRILFGGGRNLALEEETTTNIANTDLILESLKSILNEVILPKTDYTIDHNWAGIMGVGKSKQPIIKQLDANTFCGVRLGGMGVAIGTLVGKELANLIRSVQ
ncbi:MAG: FAD-binding oxidoreductase [Crocinitomicaceae bacterium]|nr:FAD-binding oxidoreductase [Crocinitomicaceae bacterium]